MNLVAARGGARGGLSVVAASAALSTTSAVVCHLAHRGVPAPLLALALGLFFAGLAVALVGAMGQLVTAPRHRSETRLDGRPSGRDGASPPAGSDER